MEKIIKILNNNAILVAENDTLDCIWIGSGIGFCKKNGDVPDRKKIERRFVMDKSQLSEDMNKLVAKISTNYLKLSVDIVEYAKENLLENLSNSVYISLADHIANSISLQEKGLSSGTELAWEVKKLYPREYSIGRKAIVMIEEQTGVKLNEFEVGNIALHLINAQTNSMQNTEETSLKIKDILTLIRFHNKIEINSESLSYDRFVTHLRFFFKRFDNRNEKGRAVSNPLIKDIKERYMQAFETMRLIEEYLNISLNEDEQLYLCLHIQKLIDDNQ